MRIEIVSVPGDPRKANEDFASAAVPASGTGGTLVVLDGVTPPAGPDGCEHGLPWFVARLGGTLLEHCGARRELTLRQCLAEALSFTSAAHSSICDLSHPRTPQATVVLARWDEESVEHLVLSDSVLLLESPTGSVTAVRDTRLDLARASLDGCPPGERGPRIEALRNTEGGFHTAAADPAVAELAVTGRTPREEVRGLAALTDGATRWTEVFRLGGWPELSALLREEGADALVARVRGAEDADPSGAAFPRGKQHDDASVVLVEF